MRSREAMSATHSRTLGYLVSLQVLVILAFQINFAYSQIHFASLGSWGTGSSTQKLVARALGEKFKTEHISFLLSPGSNFAGGVSSPEDDDWQEDFEEIYTDKNGGYKVPFFTVLGTEDWEGDYGAQIQRTSVAYSEETGKDLFPKWTIPNWWYHYITHFPASSDSVSIISSGHKDMTLGVVFIDTWILSNSFPYNEIRKKAWEDLKSTLLFAPKICDYIVVVGDKAVSQSGSGSDSSLRYYLMPLLKKANVDAYISGYAPTLESSTEDGLAHINCGTSGNAGSTSFDINTPEKFRTGTAGFCIHDATLDGIATRFVSATTGEVLHTNFQPIKTRAERNKIEAVKVHNSLPDVKFVPVPNMEKMPSSDLFIKIVGTVGMLISAVFAGMTAVTYLSKWVG